MLFRLHGSITKPWEQRKTPETLWYMTGSTSDRVILPGKRSRGIDCAMSMQNHIIATIRKIPRGKVATYGSAARAAGHPGAARQVVAVLRHSFGLPWHRVLGAGGQIKLRGDSGVEQRLRLEAEGVAFRGRRVDMKRHEFKFRKKRSVQTKKRLKPR